MSLPPEGLPHPSGSVLKDVNPVLRERYLVNLPPAMQTVARELHLVIDQLCMKDQMPVLDGTLATGAHLHHHFQAGRTMLQLPEWVMAHVTGSWDEHVPNPEDRERTFAWLRSRPAPVRASLKLFPPSCIVTAIAPTILPGYGGIAVVAGYGDDGVILSVMPGSQHKMHAPPAALQVIGYMRGWTSERVAAVLAD